VGGQRGWHRSPPPPLCQPTCKEKEGFVFTGFLAVGKITENEGISLFRLLFHFASQVTGTFPGTSDGFLCPVGGTKENYKFA